MATKATVFYSLAGVVVGSALFKANPSSLISKLFTKGDSALDSAMTMYTIWRLMLGVCVQLLLRRLLLSILGGIGHSMFVQLGYLQG